MNHTRILKEMLNIPTGSSDKTVNRNVATSGYSSFTDSQLFSGSQFWPENSQGTSQDMSLSSRASQQSSEEGSDSKFSCTYHTKPLLFGEFNTKTRASGILDKFEEDKKKSKEKNDSDLLVSECQHTRETLNKIQKLVGDTERNMAMCLEKFENFTSTLQNNLNVLQSDISQQFETLLNKVNSHKEAMTELEEKMKKSGDTAAELGSNLQNLKSDLRGLREEQQKEQNMLEEALKLLSTLVSEHAAKPSPQKVADSAIQTSPGLKEFNILQDNKLGSTQLACTSYNFEQKQVEVPPRDLSCYNRKRKPALRGWKGRKKRPLVLPQRSKCAVSDENCRPLMSSNKPQNVSGVLFQHHDLNMVTSQDNLSPNCLTPLSKEKRSSKAAGCLLTPLCCWSQDSNSSACLAGSDPISEKLPAESETEVPLKPEGLWQLFDMDCDSSTGF